MPRALISVADKRGLSEFATALTRAGYDIISSAGTARQLAASGINCLAVSDVTGCAEIMDGRVKTLHPHIHGAILARRDKDAKVLAEHGIEPIDLVVVNLYPFAQTLEQHPQDHELLVENMDIGGPAMLRAAAKNHRWVCAVVDPQDYPVISASLSQGGPDRALRGRLAAKAFAYTSAYDALIASYLSARQDTREMPLLVHAPHAQTLRYGENPHQQGRLYHFDTSSGWGAVKRYQGKELSYNNIADSDAAWCCVSEFTQPACVIVKHANPCGVAQSQNLTDAFKRAFQADSESAFGGVIALNGACDAPLAQAITTALFAEVVIAPEFTSEARAIFAAKANLRLISLPAASGRGMLKSVSGGVLWQSDDSAGFNQDELQQVVPGKGTMPLEELRFAWLVVKHVKSNAIVLSQSNQTIGIGAGQTSRVKALLQALLQARDNGFDTSGSVIASDAFFPFADSVAIAAEYGVGWIIQPGGSIRDQEVIHAAQAQGIGMVFTGQRHFHH